MYSDEHGCNETADLLRFLWGKTRTIPNMYEFGLNSKEAFDLYRQDVDPYYYERPLLERVGNALKMPSFTPPSVLKAVVAGDEIPNQAILMTNTHGETLLHMVAWNIGYQATWSNTYRGWLLAKSLGGMLSKH